MDNKIKSICDTLDRVRDLYIQWQKENKDEWILGQLNDALTNGIGNRDIWNWITGEWTTAFYFDLSDTNDNEQGK